MVTIIKPEKTGYLSFQIITVEEML